MCEPAGERGQGGAGTSAKSGKPEGNIDPPETAKEHGAPAGRPGSGSGDFHECRLKDGRRRGPPERWGVQP